MSVSPAHAALERRVALVLEIGTWAASTIIAVGLFLPSGAHVVAVGVGIFIALPVFRVALMLIAFLRAGDLKIAGVAALVLTIIALAVAVAMHTRRVEGMRAGAVSGAYRDATVTKPVPR